MKTTITLKLFPLIALTAVSGVIVAQPAQAMQPNPAANGFHPAVILTRPIQNALVARAPLAPPPRQHEAVKEAGDKVRVHGQLAAPRRQEMVKEATEKAHAPAHQAALARPETVDKAGKPALGMLVKSTATLTASKMILVGSKASRFDESSGDTGGTGEAGNNRDKLNDAKRGVDAFNNLLDLAKQVAAHFPPNTVVGKWGRGDYDHTVVGKLQRGDVGGAAKDFVNDIAAAAGQVSNWFSGLFGGHSDYPV